MITKPKHGALETRTTIAGSLRANESTFSIAGIAASYNTLSENLGGYKEKIAPGAFTRSLRAGADVRCLLNHQPDKILGRTKAGTLVLTDSDQGLRYTCQLDRSNTDHVNVYSAIKRGDISQCSFAFLVPAGGDTWDDSDGSDSAFMAIRTLRDVTLMDVSPVTYPAYPEGTAVSARAKVAAATTKSQRFGAHISVEAADGLRKHQAAVFGEQIRAEDSRALSQQEVSSMLRKMLTDCLAGMTKPQRYVTHTASHVFAVPEDVFDKDPDISEEDALRKGAWYQYGVDKNGAMQLKAAPKESQYMEGVSLQAAGVLAELREDAILKRRMRQSAGIFVR